jgi:hypothetical protein
MKKILLIDSSYPVNVRNIKIIKTLNTVTAFDVSVLAWNRTNRKIADYIDCKEYIYSSNTPYSNLWKKIIDIIPYSFFVKKIIAKINPDYIVASHWDILFIASLFKKSSKLIYENLDMPTSDNIFLYKVLKGIEWVSLKRTNTIIFASRFFESKYNFFKREKIIIENTPFRDIINSKAAIFQHDTDKIKLSFIGNLRYYNIMKNLVDAIKDLSIDLLFFGDGPDYYRLVEYTKEYSNIFLFGRYDYSDIKNIYDLSDIIWAVYPSKDINVQYAISNKFFESLIFSKPGIYSSNTKLGEYISDNKIGITINCYDINNIRETLQKIIFNELICPTIIDNIEIYKENNKLYWEDYTSDLLSAFNA